MTQRLSRAALDGPEEKPDGLVTGAAAGTLADDWVLCWKARRRSREERALGGEDERGTGWTSHPRILPGPRRLRLHRLLRAPFRVDAYSPTSVRARGQ